MSALQVMVDPLTTGLRWAWITLLALIAYLVVRALVRLRCKNWNPKHQWQVLAAIAFIALLPGTVYLELFHPSAGIYSNDAANYWIGRAVKESDRDGKQSHIARIALSSEYGSHIAMQALGYVEDKRERCLLRTLLAELPGIRGQPERQREAQLECASVQRP